MVTDREQPDMNVLELVAHLTEIRDLGLAWARHTFGVLPDGHFSVVALNDSEYALAPYPEFGAVIYRGQSRFFDPCLASLYRSDPTSVGEFIAAMRVAEFSGVLSAHPAVVDFSTWVIDGLTPRIDFEALAQHYGLPTPLLDFSSDPLVAAFFACTTFDSRQATFQPIATSSDHGVIYTYMAALDVGEDIVGSSIVGLQPLPRPGRQYAWCLRLPNRVSLNGLPYVTAWRFRHDREASEQLYDHFAGGEELCPPDPVAAVGRQVSVASQLSSQAFEAAENQFQSRQRRIPTVLELRERRIHVVDGPVCSLADEERRGLERDWAACRLDVQSRIHCRRVRYVD